MIFFLFLQSLQASVINTVLTVTKNDDTTIVSFKSSVELQKGVTGYIVHHIDNKHQVIVANIVVDKFNKSNQSALALAEEFQDLKQNALPVTTYGIEVGDEIIIATEYSRALLIAPSESLYYHLTKAISNLEWIHPDKFATFLSYRGHPSPQIDDFQEFCATASVGLLYIYAKEDLYTLDCKSFTILQSTPALFARESDQVPFYSRIETIDKSWWGISLFDSGNADIEEYDEYYLQLLKKNQENSAIFTQLTTTQKNLNNREEKE